MPLLDKKDFRVDPPPLDLKDDEEVFVCRQTNEVFRDYDSFFKRTILCNSLVWSCEITLRHGLTYEEALESEQDAREIVEEIAEPIKRGVLTLVHYTRHTRLANLCDELFNYMRERYQEGEEVHVNYKREKLQGTIHNVVEPTLPANGFDSPLKSTNNLKSPENKSVKSGKTPSKSNAMVVLSDDEGTSKKSSCISPTNSMKKSVWPDAKNYEYVVKVKRTKSTHEDLTIKGSCISRRKGSFTRDKLKLLVKVMCYRTSYWKVKEEYRETYDLPSIVDDALENSSKKRKRNDDSEESRKKSKISSSANDKKSSSSTANGKKSSSSTANGKKSSSSTANGKKSSSSTANGKKSSSSTANDKKSSTVENGKKLKKVPPEEIERMKNELKIQREKEKELRKQARDKARLKRFELLKEQKMFLLHWCVPLEDLKLDDHKELPVCKAIECNFPTECFADIVMVLEFLFIFSELFNGKQDFPDGVSLELLETALTEHDAEGSFYDIIRFLLSTILATHAEEVEEEGLDDIDHEKNMKGEPNNSSEADEDSDVTRVKKAIFTSATMAASWALVHQGKGLHELALDPFTCSEILRLHILSSGASLVSGGDAEPYRWQRRGGFTLSDDHLVTFQREESVIMRGLVTGNIYDLKFFEKLKILKALCSQLLTYATTRDFIDDGFDRWRKAKRELQEEQWADQRKDKEEAAAKYKKRMEERAKEKENKASAGNPEKDSTNKEPAVTVSNDYNDDQIKTHTRSQGPIAEQTMDAKRSEESERFERKENLRKKEKVFLKEIKKSQSMGGVQPIGRDRLFRRYWIFNSLPGLFIEDDDPNLFTFLTLDDESSELSDDDSSSVGSSVATEERPLSSATSAVSESPLSITSLSREQIECEKDLCRILKLYNIPVDNLPRLCVLNTGVQTLRLEQMYSRIKNRDIKQWSYISSKDELDSLLNSLNPRGNREKHLREALIESYDVIVKGLENNPFSHVNKQRRDKINTRPKSASTRNQSVNKAMYKTMEDFIEASLRDQMLDLEDRLWQSGLGVVKVDDVVAWRKQMENGIYDFLPDDSNVSVDENSGKMINHENDQSVLMNDQSNNSTDAVIVSENMDVDRSLSLTGKDLEQKVFSNQIYESPETRLERSSTSTPTSFQTPHTVNPCIRSLAEALIQIERGIEKKYLIPPLGSEVDLNDGKKKKDHSNDKTKGKSQKSLLERWEDSLMSCTNLAQVFIHLSNLDNCVSWDKSVLNARCRICRRKGDAEHMLLCDGCDKGFHMYCLKPPISKVPEGDWFCSQCRPAESRRNIQRRKRDKSRDEDEAKEDIKLFENPHDVDNNNDENGEGSGDENEDDDDETEDEDDYSEDNDDQDMETKEDEVNHSDDDESVHMETCACCGAEGELLCCETCPLVYHVDCAYPPLRRVPRGEWICQVCSGADRDLPTSRRIKKSIIRDARSTAKKKDNTKSKKPKISTTSAPSKSTIKINKDTKKTVTTTRHNNLLDVLVKVDYLQNTPVTRRTVKKSNTQTPCASASRRLPNSAPAKTSRMSAALVKQCEKLLKELTCHEDAWPFLFPVDANEVPDYHLVIKAPMDFQTIQKKLTNYEYCSTDDIAKDIRQIFFNCSEYNKPRAKEAKAGVRLSAYFETRFGELGLDFSEPRGPRTRRSR